MTIREDLVSSALTFLNDPKVQASPLTKRLAFLESKGLTQEEITEVLNRLNNPSQYPSSTPATSSTAPPIPQYSQYGNPYGQPPEPPSRDWRDWFIMAVVSTGITYGLYTLAQRYVVPLLKPPTPPELEEDKALVTASFDEAQRTLEALKTETQQLKESQEEEREKVEAALEDVEAAVLELKEAGKSRESDIRSIKADLETIRELIPKALERNKEAQVNQLQDLQNELKSLKSLLLSRTGPRSFPPTMAFSASAPNVNPNSTTNGDAAVGSETLNAAGMPPPAEITPTPSPIPFLGNRQPGIPAWQLAARQKIDESKGEDQTVQP